MCVRVVVCVCVCGWVHNFFLPDYFLAFWLVFRQYPTLFHIAL